MFKAVVGAKFDVLGGVQQGSVLSLVLVFYQAHTLLTFCLCFRDRLLLPGYIEHTSSYR